MGIHSRNERTYSEIASRAKVGNCYINRDQVGAVVGVQPFGGRGLSGTGPKAGGTSLFVPFYAVERLRQSTYTHQREMDMEQTMKNNSHVQWQISLSMQCTKITTK